MATPSNRDEDYLFRDRSAAETQRSAFLWLSIITPTPTLALLTRPSVSRLNWQHYFLLEVIEGHLIHPSVPMQELKDIADVGTGTG